jgi:hypothetical protein
MNNNVVVAPSGSGNISIDVPIEVQEAHERLHEAMKGLPEKDTAAYHKACDQALQLVLSESNPVWFLQMEYDNVEKAAMRMSKYWTARFRMFQERALLPMNDLTGKGALNEENIGCMKLGVTVMLPRDIQGRSVLCLDYSRFKDTAYADPASQWQRLMFFFFGYLVALNPVSQTEAGVVILTIYHEAVMQDRSKIDEAARLVHFVFPSRFKISIACFLPPQRGNFMFKRTYTPAMVSEILSW